MTSLFVYAMAGLGDLERPACFTKDASKLFTVGYRSERESLAICSKTSSLVPTKVPFLNSFLTFSPRRIEKGGFSFTSTIALSLT